MKVIVCIAAAVVATARFALAGADAAGPTDVEAIKAEARSDAEAALKVQENGGAIDAKARREAALNRPEVLRKTGGFLDVPAKGTAIVVLDMRARPGGACDQFATVFRDLSKARVDVVRKPGADDGAACAGARSALASTGAAFALCVADAGEAPALGVYPEERIVVVNASALKGGDDPLAPEVRVVKELWRGLGFVAGLGYAQFPNDVHQPVYSLAELDALEYQVMQPMHFDGVYRQMGRFGATRARHIPYRLAVFEGWAASPTNEYQRIVWDEVKAWQATNALKKASAPAAK